MRKFLLLLLLSLAGWAGARLQCEVVKKGNPAMYSLARETIQVGDWGRRRRIKDYLKIFDVNVYISGSVLH